jgi:hypothetical protein
MVKRRRTDNTMVKRKTERVSFCCSCMAVSQCALKELVSAVYA